MLAGGRSSRFGSDKLAARVAGETILERAVRSLAPAADHVIIVIGPSGPAPDLPGDLPHRVVRDAEPFEGPLAGVACGLASVTTELAVVVAGDMPFVHPGVVGRMLRAATDAAVDAVALMDGKRLRPLPCVLRTEPALEAARALLDAGERRLRALLGALRVAAVDEPTWTGLDPDRRTLVDIDEPGDLAR